MDGIYYSTAFGGGLFTGSGLGLRLRGTGRGGVISVIDFIPYCGVLLAGVKFAMIRLPGEGVL